MPSIPPGSTPLNLIGTDGDDTLQGAGANDTLTGGAGNDLLLGGFGNDTYIVRFADAGQDTISADYGDVIDIQDAIKLADLSVRYVSDPAATQQSPQGTLYLGLPGAEQELAIQVGLLNLPFDGVTVRTGTGESTALVNLIRSSTVWQGTSGNDEILGSVIGERIEGLAGDDVITGGAGEDTLLGGAGNDTLVGGDGRDVYEVRFSDEGQDTLAIQATDVINIQDAIGLSALSWRYVADPAVASGGQAHQVQVGLASKAGQPAELTLELGISPYLPGTVEGLHLQSILVQTGNGESDTLAHLLSKVTLQATGTAAADLFKGTFANERFDGEAGDDFMVGGDGQDTLVGGSGQDDLSGDLGNDSLDGGLGRDTLAGGPGNDTMAGGKGSDLYQFNRGWGQDLIIDHDSTLFNRDELYIGNANANQLWFTRSGNDLNVAIIGTTDKVTIQGWFASSANRIETFLTEDGKSLSSGKVSALVAAMSSFTNQAMAGTELGSNVPTTVTKLIDSSWR